MGQDYEISTRDNIAFYCCSYCCRGNVSKSQTYKLGIFTNNNEHYTSMAYEKDMGNLEIRFWDLSDKPATNFKHKFIRGILLYPNFTVEHLIFSNPTSVFIEGHYLPSDAQNKGQLQDGILYVEKSFNFLCMDLDSNQRKKLHATLLL